MEKILQFRWLIDGLLPSVRRFWPRVRLLASLLGVAWLQTVGVGADGVVGAMGRHGVLRGSRWWWQVCFPSLLWVGVVTTYVAG